MYGTGKIAHHDYLMVPIRGESSILTEDAQHKLLPFLPARAVGSIWTLIYSTGTHGFSLKTLYRRMQSREKPVLLAIKDIENHVFGAILSTPLKVEERFYGTGESCLFTFSPEFKAFEWTGLNDFFIRCQLDNVVIGASQGKYGIWLDEDLYHGRTQSCETFENDPLCLCKDFTIKALETWSLS